MISPYATRSIVLRKLFMDNYRGRFDISAQNICSYICLYSEICHNLYAKSGEICCNNVEKLCKRLRKNLRICCEKFLNMLWIISFYVLKLWKNNVFHRTVEKFYIWFCAGVFLCKNGVLHSFHIAYYYNYLFIK